MIRLALIVIFLFVNVGYGDVLLTAKEAKKIVDTADVRRRAEEEKQFEREVEQTLIWLDGHIRIAADKKQTSFAFSASKDWTPRMHGAENARAR